MFIWWTTKASGSDARVDGWGEFAVFDNSNRLAWKIRKSLVLASGLNPAVIHPEDETVFSFFYDLLFVQTTVKTKV